MIQVDVVRALGPAQIHMRALTLPDGANVADAVRASNLETPEIAGYAIYGERVSEAHLLRDGDRLELLRGLLIDPKQARRRRAAMQRAKP